jgi:putative membrane protein
MDAAHINMAEVEVGQLAQQRSTNDRVKDFGQRLFTDHSRALSELKNIAREKDITLPTSLDAKHKALADKLSKLSGPAFDREFTQAMVEGHQEALKKAQAEAKSGSDPQLKDFAQKMATSVEEHLKIAKNLAGGAVGTTGTQDRSRNPGAQPQPGTPDQPDQPDRNPQ